jgi:hypothetical protein
MSPFWAVIAASLVGALVAGFIIWGIFGYWGGQARRRSR